MPKIIIIRGNSGSGKTSLAKAIQKKIGMNTMLISQDVVRRDILKTHDGPNNQALPLLMEMVRYGYLHNEVVILEGILHSSWYTPLFELVLELYQRDIWAYYFSIPFETTVNRHFTKPNCHDFGVKELTEWWNPEDYLPMIFEKKFTEIFTLEEECEMVLKDLKLIDKKDKE